MRIMLDRSEDMIESGGRHPFLGKYKVGKFIIFLRIITRALKYVTLGVHCMLKHI